MDWCLSQEELKPSPSTHNPLFSGGSFHVVYWDYTISHQEPLLVSAVRGLESFWCFYDLWTVLMFLGGSAELRWTVLQLQSVNAASEWRKRRSLICCQKLTALCRRRCWRVFSFTHKRLKTWRPDVESEVVAADPGPSLTQGPHEGAHKITPSFPLLLFLPSIDFFTDLKHSLLHCVRRVPDLKPRLLDFMTSVF